MVAGKVSTQAVAIRHAVDGCSPAPDPTIVPEMPPVTPCVVLTGKPVNPAVPITAAAANSADPPCARHKILLAEALTERRHDATDCPQGNFF